MHQLKSTLAKANTTFVAFKKPQQQAGAPRVDNIPPLWFLPSAVVVGTLVGVLFVLILIGGYGLRTYQQAFVQTTPPTPHADAPTPSPTPTPDPLAAFGVLVLGFGGNGHDGGYLTDTMIVAYVQPRRQRIDLISLPRDLWVPIPVAPDAPQSFKLNAAYAIGRDDRRYSRKAVEYTGAAGGGTLAKKVVSDVVGLPIEYFVAVSFQGFINGIDTLGGVTVTVPTTFEDPLYPIEEKKNDLCGLSTEEFALRTATLSGRLLEESFTCRYEPLHFDQGKQLLDGTTALKYVRSRHSPQAGGDFARSQRQRAVITAVKNAVLTPSFVPKAIPFLSRVTADMQTDLPLPFLQHWLGQSDALQGYSMHSIGIDTTTVLQHSTSADRQYILIPKTGNDDWSSIHLYIQEQLTATTSAPTL